MPDSLDKKKSIDCRPSWWVLLLAVVLIVGVSLAFAYLWRLQFDLLQGV